MPSPAEQLAAKKPWRRAPRNRAAPRPAVWDCRLREMREALRLSLQDVAAAVGLSATALWQVERGSDTMLTTARALAEFFGKPVEELWPRRQKKGHQPG